MWWKCKIFQTLPLPTTEEDGRKLKNIYIGLILKIIVVFVFFLKFGVFKWKCDFILSFLIQVLVLYSKIQKSWDGAKKKNKLLLKHFRKET